MNPILKELKWEDLDPETVPTLPLVTIPVNDTNRANFLWVHPDFIAVGTDKPITLVTVNDDKTRTVVKAFSIGDLVMRSPQGEFKVSVSGAMVNLPSDANTLTAGISLFDKSFFQVICDVKAGTFTAECTPVDGYSVIGYRLRADIETLPY